MKKILYLLFLAGTVFLVSVRGGNISYLLFYFALILPFLALLYSVYVYLRFRIVQEVSRTVVKSAEVPYRLILANEDYIPFLNITLHFYDEMVSIKNYEKKTDRLCLLPHQEIKVDTKMYCKYRGTYPIGVKSVTVTDFLGLFSITYPMLSQVRVTAKPRIIPLEKFSVGLSKQDSKNNLFSLSKLQDLPDFDLRSYAPRDPVKFIHWKNSAKTGELLVRRQMPEDFFEITVIIDLSPIDGAIDTRLQAEDNILEAALAFIHDYCLKKIPIRVIYMTEKLQEMVVDNSKSFEIFYDLCTKLTFEASSPLDTVFTSYVASTRSGDAYVFISSRFSPSLQRLATESSNFGHEIVLIETGESPL